MARRAEGPVTCATSVRGRRKDCFQQRCCGSGSMVCCQANVQPGRRKMRVARMVLLSALAAACLPALAQAKWDVANTMHVDGEGGWDYVTIAPRSNRFFVTRSTHTQVIDAESGK